jgi:uncharacterized protein
MLIEVEELDEKGKSFDHAYEPGEIVLDEEGVRMVEPPHIQLRASKTGTTVSLSGQLSARAEVDCDRCLKSVDVPLEVSFDAKYAPLDELESEGAHELGNDEMETDSYTGESIDVDEFVREQILLAMPTRALCGPDCKGLCPICGASRNTNPACGCEEHDVDPRWSALKNLK